MRSKTTKKNNRLQCAKMIVLSGDRTHDLMNDGPEGKKNVEHL